MRPRTAGSRTSAAPPSSAGSPRSSGPRNSSAPLTAAPLPRRERPIAAERPADERPAAASTYSGYADLPPSELDRPSFAPVGEGRVKPPWLADDLPPEPPMLRLVEPPPLADRALRDEPVHNDPLTGDLGVGGHYENPPPLRLVDGDRAARVAPRQRSSDIPMASPIEEEGDGDLLIFAAMRSAWFDGHAESEVETWSPSADTGWRAAEQAARPAVGAETRAGLPKRVPQANLVPGSPLRDERPLRIIRDAASIAAHTTGYFRGWRRGQEIGGYALGGRPGRDSAGGWDFTRDQGDHDESRDYEYRSARS